MKVLFITNIPSPYRVDFFNELGKLCNLTVTFEGNYATDRNESWKGDSATHYKAIYLKGIRTKADEFFCPEIIKILKSKWDRIIVGIYSTPTSMVAIRYLRKHKINFFLESDGGFIKDENKIKYLIKKYFVSSAKWWLVSGEPTQDYLVYYGADKDRCFRYPFTSLKKIDKEKSAELCALSKIDIRSKIGMSEKFIVLSVGRFTYEAGYGKGYDTILKTAEQLKSKSIDFYIVGDNPTDEFVEWKERKQLNNVHFVGFKKKDELAYYYAASDLFVLMTKSDVWGLVINEAMLYGLPVITTNKCIAGLELINDDKNGYILPVGDVEGLSNKISYLFEKPEKCLYMSSNNRIAIEEYTVEQMAIRHKEVLDNYGNKTAASR